MRPGRPLHRQVPPGGHEPISTGETFTPKSWAMPAGSTLIVASSHASITIRVAIAITIVH